MRACAHAVRWIWFICVDDIGIRAPGTHLWPLQHIPRRSCRVLRTHRSIRCVQYYIVHTLLPRSRAPVQGFFSFRIYSLSRKVYIPLFIWIMSFWRLLSGILVLTGTLQSSNVEGAEGQWGWALLASWSVSAANDLAITVALVTILIRQRTYAQKRYVWLLIPPFETKTSSCYVM